jgi:hypothetical protein
MLKFRIVLNQPLKPCLGKVAETCISYRPNLRMLVSVPTQPNNISGKQEVDRQFTTIR